MTPFIHLGSRRISAEDPCYLIAEIGVNHNGDIDHAHRLVDAAADAGADAVKFQTYVTDELVLPDAIQAPYQTRNIGEATTQADMLRIYELPFNAFAKLRDHCQKRGLDFLSTAFDAVSLEFMISLNPVCLKWASGELTNQPMLRQAAQSGLPLLLSTGMGSFSEISRAVDWLEGQVPLVILQCVSDYPAEIADQNLRVIPSMSAAFGCPAGFSDHTLGPYAALAARGLGMSVLEKHFTLDKTQDGPDHRASVEPAEFKDLVDLMRRVEAGLGDGVKRPRAVEMGLKGIARKSLVYRRDLPTGHIIQDQDLTAKRPGIGLAPDVADRVTGRRLSVAVKKDNLVTMEHITG